MTTISVVMTCTINFVTLLLLASVCSVHHDGNYYNADKAKAMLLEK
jgi:hypothetical protein